ncbi:MAG TPA: hypothetical protein VGN20_01720 [Mucilaginibacter sp.]
MKKLKKYGSLISVTGALILFFSWSVHNTLYERYLHLKISIQSAEQTFRLYSTLHELRNNINGLATEVVGQHFDIDASQYRSGLTSDPIVNKAHRDFDLTRLNAHQLKELMDFAVKTCDLSNSVGVKSPIGDQIIKLTNEIMLLRDSVSYKEGLAENENSIPLDRLTDKSFSAIYGYIDFWRNVNRTRISVLYPEIINLSNIRVKEAHEILLKAENKSEFADSLSFYLYIFGSILAIGGQAMDKLIKTDVK